jgi:hypothetical protein
VTPSLRAISPTLGMQEAHLPSICFLGARMKVVVPPLPSNSDMNVKMKRFLLISLAACVAIDVVALWMLW